MLYPIVNLNANVPIPCMGRTSVSYRVPPGTAKAELVIRDGFSGKVWRRQALTTGEQTVAVPLVGMLPGAYIYSLELDGAPVAHHRRLVQ